MILVIKGGDMVEVGKCDFDWQFSFNLYLGNFSSNCIKTLLFEK